MRIMQSWGEEMKRKVLLKMFIENGWWKLRDGANHDIYTNGCRNEPIPRHTEINDMLAKAIIKRNGLK